jgi:hypothetical protein
VRPTFLAVLVIPIAGGCGSESGSQAPTTPRAAPFSARFVQKTTYYDTGGSTSDTTTGAFDWDSRRGWAQERPARLRTVQIGERCFTRQGHAQWKESRATDPDGTCSYALFASPKSQFKLLQQIAGLKAVGKVEIGGTETTHYRGTLDVGAVKGPIEVWVDDDGVVRRERQSGEDNGFVSTTNYYAFGSEVAVDVPDEK